MVLLKYWILFANALYRSFETQCITKGGTVEPACQMDRAFAVKGIPPGRVRRAEELGFKPHAHHRFIRCHPDNPVRGLPGGPAWRTPQHTNLLQKAICQHHFELGGTELFAIGPQTHLPGKGASDRGRQDPMAFLFFAGSHHRYIFLKAKGREIV